MGPCAILFINDSPIPTQVATESSTEPLTVAPPLSKSDKRIGRQTRCFRTGVVVAMPTRGMADGLDALSGGRGAGLFMFHPFGGGRKVDETARSVITMRPCASLSTTWQIRFPVLL